MILTEAPHEAFFAPISHINEPQNTTQTRSPATRCAVSLLSCAAFWARYTSVNSSINRMCWIGACELSPKRDWKANFASIHIFSCSSIHCYAPPCDIDSVHSELCLMTSQQLLNVWTMRSSSRASSGLLSGSLVASTYIRSSWCIWHMLNGLRIWVSQFFLGVKNVAKT